MAALSDCEATCEADPNFAVICGFLEKFGTACGLPAIDFLDLQDMLENTQQVSPILVDLHIKLLRKIRKAVTAEKWERTLIKTCHLFNSQDAWEVERFGYKKARITSKLRILKYLLEKQFDLNVKFKNEINKMAAEELRTQPLGRDKKGHAYWYQNDESCQIRVYKEDPDEETWELVAKDRDGLVALISELDGSSESKTDQLTNEDSNSLEIEKPTLDTGQTDVISKKSDEDSSDSKSNMNGTELAPKENIIQITDSDSNSNIVLNKIEPPSDVNASCDIDNVSSKAEESLVESATAVNTIQEEKVQVETPVKGNSKESDSSESIEKTILQESDSSEGIVKNKLQELDSSEAIAKNKLQESDSSEAIVNRKLQETDSSEVIMKKKLKVSDSIEVIEKNCQEEPNTANLLNKPSVQLPEKIYQETPITTILNQPPVEVLKTSEVTIKSFPRMLESKEKPVTGTTKLNITKIGQTTVSKIVSKPDRLDISPVSAVQLKQDNFLPGVSLTIKRKVEDSSIKVPEFKFKEGITLTRVTKKEDQKSKVENLSRITEKLKQDVKPIGLRLKPITELLSPDHEKKAELSNIRDKFMRSEHYGGHSNRKVLESTSFVEHYRNEMKRSVEYDQGESSAMKLPRMDRPTMLGNRKFQRPYRPEYIEEDEDEDEVGPAIQEPLMLIRGQGSGRDNKSLYESPQEESPIVGEVIEEETRYTYGEGSGADNLTGNEDAKPKEDAEVKENREVFRSPPKKSRWECTNDESDDASQEEPKKSFFFGPASGFKFNAKSIATSQADVNKNNAECADVLDESNDNLEDEEPNKESFNCTENPQSTDQGSTDTIPNASNTSSPQSENDSSAPLVLESSPKHSISEINKIDNNRSAENSKEISLEHGECKDSHIEGLASNQQSAKELDQAPKISSETEVETKRCENEEEISTAPSVNCNNAVSKSREQQEANGEVEESERLFESNVENSNSQTVDVSSKDVGAEESDTLNIEQRDTSKQGITAEESGTLNVVEQSETVETSKLNVDEKEISTLNAAQSEIENSSKQDVGAEESDTTNVAKQSDSVIDTVNNSKEKQNKTVKSDASDNSSEATEKSEESNIPVAEPVKTRVSLRGKRLIGPNKMTNNKTIETEKAVPVAVEANRRSTRSRGQDAVDKIAPASKNSKQNAAKVKKDTPPVVEEIDDKVSSKPMPKKMASKRNLRGLRKQKSDEVNIAEIEEQIIAVNESDVDVSKTPVLCNQLTEVEPGEPECVSKNVTTLGDDDKNCSDLQAEDKSAKLTLQTLSFDYSGDSPSPVIPRITRKRGRVSPVPESNDTSKVGKRRKIKGKRSVDTALRRSVEEQRNTAVVSSDDDQITSKKPKEEKQIESEAPKEKKQRAKKKKSLLGLDIEDIPSDLLPNIRHSRRIAQQKIKEEAERRKIEDMVTHEVAKPKQKKKQKKENDVDYKVEKKKKIITDDDDTNDVPVDSDDKKKRKRKRKHKNPKFDELNPWKSSSDGSSSESHAEEEEEVEYEEEEERHPVFKSDHEFSPESDLENDEDYQPLKRARTVKKEDAVEEDALDDTSCEKCSKSDHPEWILLCDICDSGWHCSCLRPPLLVIPEGDWHCPPCQHEYLVKKLRECLVEFDKKVVKREMEVRRKERLAYVGISLDNVLPAKDSEGARRKKLRNESEESQSDDSESRSSSSSSGTDSDDEPIYQLRQRRQAHSYRFNDYDDLINSAIQDEVDAAQHIVEPVSRGKDMSTIVNAENEKEALPPVVPPENPRVEEDAEHESEDEVIKPPVKKLIGRKKQRKLNSLDVSSEDEGSDEDFRGTSSDEEDDDEFDDADSDSSSFGRRRGKHAPVRRSTRARVSRYDRDFINDDSDDEPPKRKRRSIWDESESEEESDRSWGRTKRRGGGAKRQQPRSKKKTKKKKKNLDDSDDKETFRKKRPKIKYGGLESEEEDVGRRTRGKKITYVDALGSDSEDEVRRKNAIQEDSEDEFVLNEEDANDDGIERDSDDSNDDGPIVVAGVKSGSKKGKGKGGIKRIKRAQGEELEALFPPLPSDDAEPPKVTEPPKIVETPTVSEPPAEIIKEVEPSPIEQINKNLEEMDEKQMEMMMEEEEYANKQLQMMAEQLEKEKQRKELESKKLAEIQSVEKIEATPPPPILQRGPISVKSLESLQNPPTVVRGNYQLSVREDLTHLNELPGLVPQAPGAVQVPNVPFMAGDKSPRARARKPKPNVSPDMLVSDEFNESIGQIGPDGTPKKRRGRGKGKKTLEKEAAAAAAAAAAVGTTTGNIPPGKEGASDLPETLTEVGRTTSSESKVHGGKLVIASAPQPFAQSQPVPSVITRMLQSGSAPFPVGTQKYYADQRPEGPPPPNQAFIPGAPRNAVQPPFRGGLNHFQAARPGAPPIPLRMMSPNNVAAPPAPPASQAPAPIYHHHTSDPSPSGGGTLPVSEHNSPSSSPVANKDAVTPPPSYARPPLPRFPPVVSSPMKTPQAPPVARPTYHPTPPAQPLVSNYHFEPYPSPNPAEDEASAEPYPSAPYSDQQPFNPVDDVPPEPEKNYDEENGEFGGLVSYFSSQREDDLDS